jgi:hypothetical protein
MSYVQEHSREKTDTTHRFGLENRLPSIPSALDGYCLPALANLMLLVVHPSPPNLDFLSSQVIFPPKFNPNSSSSTHLRVLIGHTLSSCDEPVQTPLRCWLRTAKFHSLDAPALQKWDVPRVVIHREFCFSGIEAFPTTDGGSQAIQLLGRLALDVFWSLRVVGIDEAGAGALRIFPWEGRAGLLCSFCIRNGRLDARSQRTDQSSSLAY